VKAVLFYHSLVSDWNHGNAHFLRGIVSELIERGVAVDVYEPEDAWSARNLVADAGPLSLEGYRSVYPRLSSIRYRPAELDLPAALEGADLVLVHEWNKPALVRAIGEHHGAHPGYSLLFHDTHHRSVTAPEAMATYDLSRYDGVLAFGDVVAAHYVRNGWARRAWTWHEAADVRVFFPQRGEDVDGDLVWIGNWGDGERSAELREFLIEPVRALGLRAMVYGVRYPNEARRSLEEAGIQYGGWLPNYRVPEVFARYRMTLHVPRGPYAKALPGIPTIRPFEALACGIPLLSAPWSNCEGLFAGEEDFLTVRTGGEMVRAMRGVLTDPAEARRRAGHGVATIRSRHTCAHRVDELMRIHEEVRAAGKVEAMR
jgi:spore maturation protein CgeB